MLILEIAFGIVLGWLIITNFEVLIEFFSTLVSSVLKLFLAPFKLVIWLFKEIREVLNFYKKGIAYVLLFSITVSIVFVVGAGIFINFVPEKNIGTILWLLFGVALITAIFIFFKDMLEFLSSKTKKEDSN